MKNYFVALVVFFAIDMVWLGLIAKNLYSKYIGFLMADKVNWIAALIFYFLFIVGLVVFVINPGLASNSLIKTAGLGALFGLITYATYDLTNLATIKNWPLNITIIDLIWGTTLSTLVSLISFFILKKP